MYKPANVEVFTVAKAKDALAKNKTNRSITKARVERYAESLKRGQWLVNGEAIVFDEDGHLVQGQHRMLAVISSGIPMETYVVRGVPTGAFKTLDSGRNRSVSDVFGINKELNTRALAAACRAVEYLVNGLFASQELFTASRAEEILVEYPTLRYWTHKFVGKRTLKSNFPTASIGVFTLAAEVFGSELIEDFVEALDSGAGLEAGNPALVLRNKFNEIMRGSRIRTEFAIALIIKAINAYCHGKKIKVLRYAGDEEYPQLG
jgi:hypothetical protein